MIKKQDSLEVICFGGRWDNPIWTNVQNVMSGVAKSNKVLYVEARSFFIFAMHPVMLKKLRKLRKENKSPYLCTIFTLTPFDRYSKLIQKINRTIILLQLKPFLKKLNFKNTILWLFSPYAGKFVGQFNEKLVCYHCTDEFSAFPIYSTLKKKKEVQTMEKESLKKADIVFTTAKTLYERKKKYNPNTYLMPNPANIDHFSQVLTKNLEIPHDIKGIKKPVVGYIGAIDKYKLDSELIEYIAKSRPDWSIVMIGGMGICDTTTYKTVPKRENIHYLGQKRFDELPNYIKHFDVCIIPYNINNYTETVFPLKFFEYMATGKPIVTTNLPALDEYKDIVGYAKDKEEFMEYIKKTLKEEDQVIINERLKIAKANSWDARVEEMIKIIKLHLINKIGGGIK
jgi:glycosyltransferase involved in cell wall biosynthesis